MHTLTGICRMALAGMDHDLETTYILIHFWPMSGENRYLV
jgi:hypothetical protein